MAAASAKRHCTNAKIRDNKARIKDIGNLRLGVLRLGEDRKRGVLRVEGYDENRALSWQGRGEVIG
jgi:hypothetical protein